jgi:integrase
MGAVRKAGDRWRAEVRRRGVYDSEMFRTKAEAVRWMAEREADIEDGRVGKVPRKTLREAFERYEETETGKKRGWRAESIRIAKFKATIPFIDKPLTEITSDDWSTWRDSLAAGSVDRKPLAPGSIARDFNVIRAMCRIALDEWGWLKVNVLTRVKSPAPPPGKERVMSPKEVKALCAALGYTNGAPTTQSQRVALGLLFAVETGMRAGEIFGLRASNVDYKNRVVHLPLTKNGQARNVPLSRRAIEILELSAGGELAFGPSAGSADALYRKYRPKDLVDITFHASRHTAATRLGSSGKLTPFELCRMFGWTDMKMALRYFNATAADIAAKLD